MVRVSLPPPQASSPALADVRSTASQRPRSFRRVAAAAAAPDVGGRCADAAGAGASTRAPGELVRAEQRVRRRRIDIGVAPGVATGNTTRMSHVVKRARLPRGYPAETRALGGPAP